MVDPVADMLTRIRNALAVHKSHVEVPYSKTKEALARVLLDAGFVNAVEIEGEGHKRSLRIDIDQTTTQRSITELHRISKPGRRVYAQSRDIPQILRGRGIVVVSTSSGVMNGSDAKKQGIGGELMCKVW